MWEQTESNRRPSACKADALNQLSYAPEHSLLKGIAKIQSFFDSPNIFFTFLFWIAASGIQKLKNPLCADARAHLELCTSVEDNCAKSREKKGGRY